MALAGRRRGRPGSRGCQLAACFSEGASHRARGRAAGAGTVWGRGKGEEGELDGGVVGRVGRQVNGQGWGEHRHGSLAPQALGKLPAPLETDAARRGDRPGAVDFGVWARQTPKLTPNRSKAQFGNSRLLRICVPTYFSHLEKHMCG